MSQLNLATVPELRPYQNQIYGIMRNVPGLSNAGLMWAPLSGALVRIRKAEDLPETYLVLFEEADSSASARTASAAETIQARQKAIQSQGMSLGLAGLGVVAGAVGLVAAAGAIPLIIAGAGLAAASYGFGIALGKTAIAMNESTETYEATLASQDLQDKEFWSDILGLASGAGAAALALKGAASLGRVKSVIEAIRHAPSVQERAAILSRLSGAQKEELIDFLKGLKNGQVLKNQMPGKAGLSSSQRIDRIVKGIELAHGATGRKQFAVKMIHAAELVPLMRKAILAERFGQVSTMGAAGVQSYMSGATGTITDKLTTPFGTIQVALPASCWSGMKLGNTFAISHKGPKGEVAVKVVGWTIFQRPMKNFATHGEINQASPRL